MGTVALRSAPAYLAVDASGVTAAFLTGGVKGPRVRTLVHEPLPPGAVLPRASAPNVLDPEALRGCVARALGARDRRIRLVLPDGVARLALLQPPRGVEPREFVRYSLAPSLPWPAGEGLFETLDAGAGRVVGAGVRRGTVAEYEQAALAAGASIEGVQLAPLLALAGLRRGAAAGAHALLGDAAVCLAIAEGGAIASLRSRRRDRSPGEASRLRLELERLAATAANGNGTLPVALTGSDAEALRAVPGADAGRPRGASPGAGAEACWLAGLVA